VHLHKPSLDDVFLAKTGRPLAGAGEEAEEEQAGVLAQLASTGVPGTPSPAGT